jgi:hypothetical protein
VLDVKVRRLDDMLERFRTDASLYNKILVSSCRVVDLDVMS